MPGVIKSAFSPMRASALQTAPQLPGTKEMAANGQLKHAEPAKCSSPAAQKPLTTYKVPVLLAVSDQLFSEQGPGIIRSRLCGEERQIIITLNKADVLISKALSRADTMMVKFA